MLKFEEYDKFLLDQKSHIIHQVWFGTIPNKREARKTYKKLKTYRDSWIDKNPSWYRAEWNKEMSLTLLKTHYPEHLDMYRKYKYEIQRCDAVRYFILHRYGGFYADMDYTCCRPVDEIIKNFSGTFYLVQSPNTNALGSFVSNSLMYSISGHVFWRKLFLILENEKTSFSYLSKHIIVMYTTGPVILTKAFNEYKIRYSLSCYPWDKFHPLGINTEFKTLEKIDPSIYAIHLGKGSWESGDSKILLFFVREKWLIIFILLTLIVPFVLAIAGKYTKKDRIQAVVSS